MNIFKTLKPDKSFYRFLIVGIINTVTGLTIMLSLLNWFGWSYWGATFTGNSIGAIVSYFLNRSFTFHSSVHPLEGIPKFIIVILVCYVLAFSVSEAISLIIPFPFSAVGFISRDEIAVIVGSGLYTFSNYLGQKVFVFRRVAREGN
ncbi:GtrA family protein [Mesobacillus maritimus]|uniref:GtrA family protein n=1 Tax=Mesobacillus maritimus TaxID=1643336 RepID=UPI00203E01D9|nr:GtrA family protein [Mesobacillus maritimus]MCM3585989.1 GtrA family protein [Mesobacillus maritimus]MCM3670350.1 GtrA family protein [Mesobacillus maritimus]